MKFKQILCSVISSFSFWEIKKEKEKKHFIPFILLNEGTNDIEDNYILRRISSFFIFSSSYFYIHNPIIFLLIKNKFELL